MDPAGRESLIAWIAEAGMAGLSEDTMLAEFSVRARALGLHLEAELLELIDEIPVVLITQIFGNLMDALLCHQSSFLVSPRKAVRRAASSMSESSKA